MMCYYSRTVCFCLFVFVLFLVIMVKVHMKSKFVLYAALEMAIH